MLTSAIAAEPFLICQSAARCCGFPLKHVVEIMRVLPVEAIPAMPSFMLGLSMIRGAMVPVVNLAMLLGGTADGNQAGNNRYVTVSLDQRLVAFMVDSVVGVQSLATAETNGLPPLLGQADQGIIAAISTLDADLFLILEASRVIPESLWQDLALQEISV